MLGRTRKGRPFFSGDQGELTQPARIVGEWGESSPLYISSVLGRFPDNLKDVVDRLRELKPGRARLVAFVGGKKAEKEGLLHNPHHRGLVDDADQVHGRRAG